MAHVTERSVVSMNSFYNRLEVFFNESQQTFVNDLKHARVTTFVSVPRLWFKFRSQILAALPDDQLQALLKSDKGSAVIEQIRNQLGFSHCQIFGSGTAPIAKELLDWFAALNININEAWGMTEVSGVGCANSVYRLEDMGTVGRPVKGLELKLSAEKEIYIRGEAIFRRYYRNTGATDESFDDGWFKTGDMGEITQTGAVKIIGRVKEQFKSAKGKYVSPVPIESKLSACNLVDQVCVVGSGMPQPVALLVLAEGLEVEKKSLTAKLEQLLSDVNSSLESHEVLDALLIVAEDWTIESGLLTPTLKLKRAAIEGKYQSRWKDIVLKGVCW